MNLIDKKENQIVFKANIEDSLANAIRRYLSQIPIVAIDEVEISKNDSPLYDETIAHRLGLIPIKMDKSFDKPVKIKLSSNSEGTVYSDELKGANFAFNKIPITSLSKGQEIELTGTTKIGVGNQHSKFSPGLMFYRNIVDITLDPNCPVEIANICPKKILKADNGKITVHNPEKCDMCEACSDFCKKKGKGSITLNPTNELLITLESFGQLLVGDIFKKSIDVLKKDLTEVSKNIK